MALIVVRYLWRRPLKRAAIADQGELGLGLALVQQTLSIEVVEETLVRQQCGIDVRDRLREDKGADVAWVRGGTPPIIGMGDDLRYVQQRRLVERILVEVHPEGLNPRAFPT